jgi:hypothetical protein
MKYLIVLTVRKRDSRRSEVSEAPCYIGNFSDATVVRGSLNKLEYSTTIRKHLNYIVCLFYEGTLSVPTQGVPQVPT